MFYPGNRIVKVRPDPKLNGSSDRDRANDIRARIAAAVASRRPQVMVNVTGGGRGMTTIAAHFRYISKNGRLDIEDDHCYEVVDGMPRDNAASRLACDSMMAAPTMR